MQLFQDRPQLIPKKRLRTGELAPLIRIIRIIPPGEYKQASLDAVAKSFYTKQIHLDADNCMDVIRLGYLLQVSSWKNTCFTSHDKWKLTFM